jgi:large subunit ribosomal protein L18
MKKGPRYKIPFKRRKSEKTNYKTRLRLLSSKELRLVVRKSLKNLKAQIIQFDIKGDKTLVSATSQDLKKFGWDYSSNISSGYLVGLLLGKRALKKGIKSAILDIGLQKSVKGSRIYSVLKGAVDAGLDVPHSPEIFPSDERIKGSHIIDYAEKLKKDKKKYKKQFTVSKPEKISEMFEQVKSKIMKG